MTRRPSLKSLIALAREHGACDEALAEVERCGTLRKALRHKDAPDWASWMAYYCRLRKPWMKQIILRGAWASCLHACDIPKHPWPKAEAVIRTDAHAAYSYARHVLDMSPTDARAWARGETK